jgi:uroporphyrinogen-III synthase
MATLIATYGGRAITAPAVREVPLESNPQAIDLADRLMRGEIDMVVLLTGVGTRALLAVVERVRERVEFVAALARTKVVARGPKPMAVLRELKVPAWLTVPEPNTWRELLTAVDEKTGESSLRGWRVAVQEYGVSNPELLSGLEARGARVMRVPVYRWALPGDAGPLREAIAAIAAGTIDVVMFTTSVQVVHLFQVAAEMRLADQVRRGLTRSVIASIGPTTSEELQRHDLVPDLEPTHPKMGILVRETAERAADLLQSKRGRLS